MSTTIDQKVVEMRFDNKQFEKGVSTTMSSVDKLKKSLKFEGATDGLNNVSKAARNCDVSSVGTAAEKVGLKFNALYTIADQALRNITNSAMAYSKRIVSALTIDPIKTGFSEYETQMGAIQTILANTKKEGTNLDDVNGALDELNTYADKTIYNFTEMTRNIGTFTAAGVKLDTSVQAIKGIANLAAVSGADSNKASMAMYQLSQAMASGTVKLQDWNSVVNAGMGGQVFQDALKETAKVHGTEIDKIIEKNGSFRESLKEGWLTTEILTDTLAKFTGDLTEEQLKSQGYTEKQIKEIMELGKTANAAATEVKTFTQLFDTLKEAAQSGWSQTWRILVGDFEEAKALLTKLSDTLGGIIGKSAEARNELLENWKVLGGREDLIESFKNIWEALLSVITPIKEAFQEIFPPMTAERLVAITRGIKDFTAKLKLSDKGMNNLKRTFKGLFAVLGLVKDIFTGVFKVVKSVIEGALGLNDGVLGVTAVIGDLLVAIVESIRYGGLLEKMFSGVATVTKFVIKVIASLVKGIAQIFEFAANGLVIPGFVAITEGLHNIFDGMFNVGDASTSMKDKFVKSFSAMGDAIKGSTLFKIFSTIWQGIKKVGSAILAIIKNIAGELYDLLAHGSLTEILDFINMLINAGVGLSIIDFFQGLLGGGGLKGLINSVNDVFDSLSGALKGFQNACNAKALKEIAIAIAILAAAVLVLSLINKDKLMDAVSGIIVLFTTLASSMAIISKGGGLKNLAGGIGMVIGIAVATALLAGALVKISKMDTDHLLSSILALSSIILALTVAMKLTTTADKNAKALKGVAKLIIFAYAVKMLANVVKSLGSMDWESWGRGMIGLAGCITLMVGAMAILSAIGGTKQKEMLDGDKMTGINRSMKGMAGAMLAFAAAILIMSPAIKILGSMSTESLVKAGVTIAAIVALMGVIALESKLVKPTAIITLSASLAIFAAALLKFLPSILVLSMMSKEGLTKAGITILALGGVLAGLTALSRLVKPGSVVVLASSLAIYAAAINTMIPAIILLGLMPTKSLIQAGIAIVVLSGLLAGLAALSKIVNPGSAAALAASMIILAVALTAIIVPLALLGAIPWKILATGLLMMAGVFVIFGVAGAVLSPVIPTLLGLGAAISILGIGMIALAAGLALLGPALASAGTGILSFIAKVVGAIGIIVSGLTLIITSVVKGIIEIIIAVIEGILHAVIKLAPLLGKAIIVIIGVVCDVLLSCVPKIVTVVLKLLVSILEALVEYGPTIIELLAKFLVGVFQGLAKHAGSLVEALFDIIIAILDGIAAKTPALIQSVVDIIMAVFEGAINALKSIDPKTFVQGLLAVGIMAGIVAALAAISGLIPAAMIGAVGMGLVAAELALVISSLGALASLPGLKWLVDKGGDLLGSIGTAIGKFIGGIAGGITEGFTDSLPEIGTNLSDFMTNVTPFIEGAKMIDPSVVDGVRALVGVVMAITAANVLESITSFVTGGNSIAEFSTEIVLLGHGLQGFANAVSGIDPEGTKAAVEVAKSLAEMTNCIPNEGGMVSWFTGENSISKFSSEIVALGHGLRDFASSVSGIDTSSAKSAVEVAKSLADMSHCIPNEGGVVSWFTGDNSLAKFSTEIVSLGRGLTSFVDEVAGIDATSAKAAIEVAKSLAEMTNCIPNSGGMLSWISGENSVANFSFEIKKLGQGLADFAASVSGIQDIEKVKAAIEAAKALAEMTSVIPNSEGVVSWFAGDNSISNFAGELPKLGAGLKGFATETNGIEAESVTAAANAAKALAELTHAIPNEGGVTSWFTGESSISKFGSDLSALGSGIKGFATAAEGLNTETVTTAADAGKTLAEMTNTIPNEGGIKAWFAGESSVAAFAKNLIPLGEGLKGFSDSTVDINPETMTAAANAAKALAEMTKHIPSEGGIKAWFTGETSVAKFADKLPTLGAGLSGFSKSVAEINPENVTAAANAAKALAEMTDTVPKNTDKIITFGTNLETFGGKLAAYFESTKGISEESAKASTNAVNAVKDIVGVDSGKIKSVADALNKVTKAIKDLSKVPKDTLSSFTKSLSDLGEKSVEAFKKAFDGLDKDLKKAAQAGMDGFISGVDGKKKSATTACSNLVDACAKKISDKKSAFKSAGKSLAQGLADGISADSYKAEAQAAAMAEAAYTAAKEKLRVNSPSKAFRELGYSMPEGLAVGVEKLSYMAVNATEDMTDDSIRGVKNSISRIADTINSDLDAQPAIRPVLDLSEVKKSANSISSMLGNSASIGVSANIGAISSSMRRRNQNGTNNDVVSAIKGLAKDLENNKGDTYNLGDISYDDGSSIATAVKDLVRAAKMERRV